MSRTRTVALALVLFGLVVNLAVAWSCALWWPVEKDWDSTFQEKLPDELADLPEVATWARRTNVNTAGILFEQATARGLGIAVDSLGVSELVPGDDGMGPGRVRRVHRAGWPMHSVECAGYLDWMMEPGLAVPVPPDWRGGLAVPAWFRPDTSGPEAFFFDVPRPLPLRPRILGMIADTAFYGAMGGVVLHAPGVFRRAWRRRRGLCAGCAYPVAGLERCPECGRLVRGMLGTAGAARDR